jgi:hypothetical protein
MRSFPMRETSLDVYLSRTIPERKQSMDALERTLFFLSKLVNLFRSTESFLMHPRLTSTFKGCH